MWFGFGLITATLAFVLTLRRRLQARWMGSLRYLRNLSQVSYYYQVKRAKQRVVLVRIGVTAPSGLHLRFREEGKRDQFFKWLGISEELQTSDPTFDERVYVETDAVAVHNVLREQAPLRASILRIFDVSQALRLRRLQLRCMSGRLWAEFKPKDTDALDAAQNQLVPELRAVADAFQQSRLDGERTRDPFIWRATAMLAISTAAAVLGGLGLVRGATGRTDILEPGQLFAACVPLGLIFAGAFLLLILVFLGRSSRTHVVLIEAAIVGTFGFVTGTFALAREANIEFDTSSARPHELREARVEHRITRGRRGRRNDHYYLHTPDWRMPTAAQQLRIVIDRDTYYQLAGKDGALVETRKGVFGYEWIQRIVTLDVES
jgi:hypothetical protein